MEVHSFSKTSLSIDVLHIGETGAHLVSSATGFVTEVEKKIYLVTNWHVITGRNADTNIAMGIFEPTHLKVYFHLKNNLGVWIAKKIPLFDSGMNPLWIEHLTGREIDIVLVPLEMSQVDNTHIYLLDMELSKSDYIPIPSLECFVIGFPFGLTGGGKFPIWKTGHIASEPELDYDSKPLLLIDATTRQGMSGSPVIIRPNEMLNLRTGGRGKSNPPPNIFLGIYSGRIHGQAEIGRVWKPRVIYEILGSQN